MKGASVTFITTIWYRNAIICTWNAHSSCENLGVFDSLRHSMNSQLPLKIVMQHAFETPERNLSKNLMQAFERKKVNIWFFQHAFISRLVLLSPFCNCTIIIHSTILQFYAAQLWIRAMMMIEYENVISQLSLPISRYIFTALSTGEMWREASGRSNIASAKNACPEIHWQNVLAHTSNVDGFLWSLKLDSM